MEPRQSFKHTFSFNYTSENFSNNTKNANPKPEKPHNNYLLFNSASEMLNNIYEYKKRIYGKHINKCFY